MTPRRLARWTGVVVSGLATLGCLVLLAYAWIAMLITRDDWGDRLYTLTVATLIVTVGVLLLFLRGRAPGRLTLPERIALIVTLLVVIGLVGYAVAGIDSTRPVRELPEAQLAFPGATETGRGASRETGSIFGRTPASFSRWYTTTATYGEVLDFFHRELPDRGWSDHYDFGLSSSDEQIHNWSKDGFMFQLDIARDDPEASGPFETRLLGRAP